MPTDTWVVTSTIESGIADVSAVHYNADGNSDSSFSSRLKTASTGDIDKFVTLAKQQLLVDAKKVDDGEIFAESLTTKLNA